MGRVFHRVDDLGALPAAPAQCRTVVACCPEDADTWALAAEGLGLDVATWPTSGMPDGLAFAWYAQRPTETPQ